MQIVSAKQQVEVQYHRVCFWHRGTRSGFSYPCDAEGNVNEAALSEAERLTYRACLTGRPFGVPVDRPKVQTRTARQMRPAIGQCGCGARVELSHAARNVCGGCGAAYDGNGQAQVIRAARPDEVAVA